MTTRLKTCAGLVATLSAVSFPLDAQSCARDAMLVFDGSASMAAPSVQTEGAQRIDDARQALAEALPGIAPIRRIGLMTYGPGPENSCDSINLKFPPIPEAAQPIMEGLAWLDPNGLTPLTEAVRTAAEVLNYQTTPGIIVLVTDGNDTCGGAPCALGAELARAAANLTVHVIGFRVDTERLGLRSADVHLFPDGISAAKCLSDQTGGSYVSTQTVEQLRDALRQTLGCAFLS
ncbi:vWA domain-containing protein [Primorskyibacter sp. S187A]|uniref:vWA domain-containing protein n=1 Tax=Primorskyibacter sp. S187A TaxID=3415130 RepID=UPI003C7D4881